VIVIHTTNLYNLGKELITVCWNKQQHIVKLIIRKINLYEVSFIVKIMITITRNNILTALFKKRKKQEVTIMLI